MTAIKTSQTDVQRNNKVYRSLSVGAVHNLSVPILNKKQSCWVKISLASVFVVKQEDLTQMTSK